MKDYSRNVDLWHSEALLVVDKRSGALREVTSRPDNIPNGKQVFAKEAMFTKEYNNTKAFLHRELTPLEHKAVAGLIIMAKMNTNSLEPISDDTAAKDLAIYLGVSKNKVNQVVEVLFDYGVFGKFDINNADKGRSKYWVLNPYLAFSGRIIEDRLTKLFESTHIAKAFKDPNYCYRKKKIPVVGA